MNFCIVNLIRPEACQRIWREGYCPSFPLLCTSRVISAHLRLQLAGEDTHIIVSPEVTIRFRYLYLSHSYFVFCISLLCTAAHLMGEEGRETNIMADPGALNAIPLLFGEFWHQNC